MSTASLPDFSLDENVQRLYERHRGTADRFCYTYRRATVSPNSLPYVLFLGNHSSGKSSFINYLLGDAPVQDVGIAPTDDAFTFLVYGEDEREVVGPAALELLPKELARLNDFGPELVQRVRVKIRKRDVLKNVVLVDSPGMIDASEKSISRGYDFFATIKFLAEITDLVLMMFDPDKPGTTGEAVEAMTGPLTGFFFKLRLIFNKCDRFTSMYDYARAYGALCWNLAHALQIKDLPKIYNCYLPGRARAEGSTIDLHDFDALREEIINEVKNAHLRRADNIQMAVNKDLTCLEMHARVALRVRRTLAKRQWAARVLFAGGVALFTAAGFLVANFCGVAIKEIDGWGNGFLFGLQTLGVLALSSLFGFVFFGILRNGIKHFVEQQVGALDNTFAVEYNRELSLGTRDDLRQFWELTRPVLAGLLRSRWRDLPVFAWGSLRKLHNDVEQTTRRAEPPKKA
ncbi:MAG: 50S ribosome-binding GTPase [Kiritimatiellae bacterium]|nr:50S ribosome-binding GTPase [Kiritimatiellia bacterium]